MLNNPYLRILLLAVVYIFLVNFLLLAYEWTAGNIASAVGAILFLFGVPALWLRFVGPRAGHIAFVVLMLGHSAGVLAEIGVFG